MALLPILHFPDPRLQKVAAPIERIDDEVRSIVSRGYDLARALLTSNLHVLHAIAQTLVERESLDGDEFKRLVEENQPVPLDDASLQWLAAC